jgi:transcription termination factor Rho
VTDSRVELSRLRLPELQALATERGIDGAHKLRKGELVDTLADNENERAAGTEAAGTETIGTETIGTETIAPETAVAEPADAPATDAPAAEAPAAEEPKAPARRSRRVTASTEVAAELATLPPADTAPVAAADVADDLDKLLPEVTSGAEGDEVEGGARRGRGRGRGQAADKADGQKVDGQKSDGQKSDKNQNARGAQNGAGDDGESRSSRGRYRDRKRGRGGQNDEIEPEISDDDVLIPVAGILDVLDNYAFVRTSGYLPGASDVYVSHGQV